MRRARGGGGGRRRTEQHVVERVQQPRLEQLVDDALGAVALERARGARELQAHRGERRRRRAGRGDDARGDGARADGVEERARALVLVLLAPVPQPALQPESRVAHRLLVVLVREEERERLQRALLRRAIAAGEEARHRPRRGAAHLDRHPERRPDAAAHRLGQRAAATAS